MNLPNKLTVLRMIMTPFFIVAFMSERYLIALAFFCIASLTDFFDGQIARKNNLVTNFGKIMDPLADKILVYSALCLFLDSGIIKAWMLIIILAREFVVAGMRTVAASEGKVLAAGMSGKIKTALQMFAVILMILGLGLPLAGQQAADMVSAAGYYLFLASLAATVYSGCEYVIKNKDVFSM